MLLRHGSEKKFPQISEACHSSNERGFEIIRRTGVRYDDDDDIIYVFEYCATKMDKSCDVCKELLPLHANNDFTMLSFKCHWCEKWIPNKPENRMIHAEFCMKRKDAPVCACENRKIPALNYLKERIKRVGRELELAKFEIDVIMNGRSADIFQ